MGTFIFESFISDLKKIMFKRQLAVAEKRE